MFFNLECSLNKQVTKAEEKYQQCPQSCLYNYYYFLSIFIVMHGNYS